MVIGPWDASGIKMVKKIFRDMHSRSRKMNVTLNRVSIKHSLEDSEGDTFIFVWLSENVKILCQSIFYTR